MSHKLISCTALSLGLAASAQAAPPSVAVDIAPLHSLVSQVMEGVAEPNLLIPAEASPHHYSLRPSEARALANAQVVFWVGESLTPWLEKALDNVADSAQKIEVLDIKGTVTHKFREGATFESHDHGEEEGHDDHKDEHHEEGHHDEEHHAEEHHGEEHHGEDHHDDKHHGEEKHHDEDHGGAHNFEWAGAFELSPGEYAWTFDKVDGDYADPKMKMVVLASKSHGEAAIEELEETAEKLIDSKHANDRVHGDTLTPDNSHAYQLIFDADKNQTKYRVVIKEKGVYTFFTEHMPFEFEANEHFFKDASKQDLEPIAQAPEVDHHHHHDHSGADPHAWLDPENAKVWVNAIKEVLSKHDAENAQAYARNAKQAIAQLDNLISTTRSKINSISDPKFIVFHDAYQYFEKRFGISAAGAISLSDAEAPSPARVKEIREKVKELGVTCVFTEPQFNPGLVKNVFEGTSVANIGVMDPLGANITPGNDHYQKVIEAMVESVSQCR